jgi:hypothetical protein
VPVVIILAALAILGGIVVAAMGRGGELVRQAADDPSIADFESGADVARYRPPPALFGYHAGATEYAFLLAGRALADRDAEIAWLRSRLRELQPEGERQDGELRDLTPSTGEAGEVVGEEPDPVRSAESVTQASQAARSGDET